MQLLISIRRSEFGDANMAAENDNRSGFTYEELYRQNEVLRSELERVSSSREYIWVLLVEASRRLQVSSASIKAAVSSLLNYDLFWDPANQHEFLETIDTSVDKVARLVMLLALAFRSEAGSMELKREPQSLQEILALVHANAAAKNPKMMLRLSLPKEGKPVLVDYEYLTIAFGYLFELLVSRPDTSKVKIEPVETPTAWFLDIAGVEAADLNMILMMHACKTEPSALSRYALLPELMIGLHVACEIFHLQGIDLEILATPRGEQLLRLTIPVFISNQIES
jgi:K+-sensing histidine kinase KdpD